MSELEVTADKSLRLIGGVDATGKKLEELKGYSSTVVSLAFNEGKAIVVSGTEQAEALGSVSAVNNNLRSIMAVPLTIRGKTLGVVYLDSKLTKGLFTEEDLDLLSAISTHIAVAFETTRMARVELEKVNLQKELEIQNAVATEAKKVQLLVDNMQQA
jgi:eukaryotic-like serine/threonine-protein kinase